MSNAYAIASAPEAQADTGVWTPARAPTSMLIAAAGALLGALGGGAALSVWRQRRWASAVVVGAGVAGALLCLSLPMSVRAGVVTREMWRAAIAAAALFGAFCALLAWYVRRWTRAPR